MNLAALSGCGSERCLTNHRRVHAPSGIHPIVLSRPGPGAAPAGTTTAHEVAATERPDQSIGPSTQAWAEVSRHERKSSRSTHCYV